MGTALPPACRTCGLGIYDPSHIIWNGHHYHNDHVPGSEPPPVFEVAELHPDAESPGLWIGFKTAADRAEAMKWFREG